MELDIAIEKTEHMLVPVPAPLLKEIGRNEGPHSIVVTYLCSRFDILLSWDASLSVCTARTSFTSCISWVNFWSTKGGGF